MNATIEHNDFNDVLDEVTTRLEQWGEELQEQGWRGSIGLLLEGYPEDGDWVAPCIGGSIDLERGEEHTPERYEAEDEYRDGTDDENYPMNQILSMLLKYTGGTPYWYDLGLKITPDDGVELSVRG